MVLRSSIGSGGGTEAGGESRICRRRSVYEAAASVPAGRCRRNGLDKGSIAAWSGAPVVVNLCIDIKLKLFRVLLRSRAIAPQNLHAGLRLSMCDSMRIDWHADQVA